MRTILLRLGLLPAALAMAMLLSQPLLGPRSAVAIASELDAPFDCPAPPSTPPTGTAACGDIVLGVARIACDVTNPLFDSCTSSLVDFDPISIVGAALVGVLAALGVSFDDPKQCVDAIHDKLGDLIGGLITDLANAVGVGALSSVFDPILSGPPFNTTLQAVITTGIGDIASALADDILSIEPLTTMLQCGCAIVGTAIALVNEGETAISDTKQCVGAALAAVGSAAESIGQSIECGLQHCLTPGVQQGACPTEGSVTCDPGQALVVCQAAYDQQYNMYNGQPFEFCPLNVVCAQGSPDPTTGLCTCAAGQYLQKGQCATAQPARYEQNDPSGAQCVWLATPPTNGLTPLPVAPGSGTQLFCCQATTQQVSADRKSCECAPGFVPDGQGNCVQPKNCPQGYTGTGTAVCTQVCNGINQVAVYNNPTDPSLGHTCQTCDNATQIDFGNSCKSCPPGTTKGFLNDLIDTCGPICDGGTTWNPAAAGGAGACQPCNNGGAIVVSSQVPNDGGNGAVVTNSCSCPSGGQQGDSGCPTQAQLDAQKLQEQQSVQKALRSESPSLVQGSKNTPSAASAALPQCPPGTTLDSNNNCNPQCGGDQTYDVSTGVCSSCAGGKLAATVVANSGGGLTTQKYCFCPSGQPPGKDGCDSGSAQTAQISQPLQAQSILGALPLAGRATPMQYATCAPLGSNYVVDRARQDQCHPCSNGSYSSANHAYCLIGDVAKGRFATEVALFGPRAGAGRSQPMLVNADPTAQPDLIKGDNQIALAIEEMLRKQQAKATTQEMLTKQGNLKTQEPMIEKGKKGSPTTQEMLIEGKKKGSSTTQEMLIEGRKKGGPTTQEMLIEGEKRGSPTPRETPKKQSGQKTQEMQIHGSKQGNATTQEMMIKQAPSKPAPNVSTTIRPIPPPMLPPPAAPHLNKP